MTMIINNRENIEVILRGGFPEYRLHNRNEIPQNSILFRNLFTLAGTSSTIQAHSNLETFTIPGHINYSSVAIVEENGMNCNQLKEGNRVLLTAQYSKFFSFNTMENLRNNMLCLLPEDMDMVNALFIPLLCKAISLCNLRNSISDRVLMLGCDIIGLMMIMLMNLEGIRPVVVLDKCEYKHDLLRKKGVSDILDIHSIHLNQELKKFETVFVISQPNEEIDELAEYESYDKEIIYCSNMNTKNCMAHDTRMNAIELLENSDIYVKDLIACHVHAEHVNQVFNDICENKYSGKALVYDW
ncbi:MDR/zinc-dependent alcohol dehydrogenase-like family protein [Acetivibrio mesophilus]|uniref:Alcohol dehydrogenase-like C-terminal domain-containing protein n=1 Tax=Acetivibrio mesophilus TaxID=2487273 RepID=A0A4Q0I8A8_9FIRM|nr:hypothetical protein [Acetivibrio mesophilus]ODM26253.1 hypothetical protein A7W90_08450 [Clostridium sp. Bc-iso-3]RXE60694.1 hypothetical protein EFD62_01890 [Acetivibrio mesophilus]HHV28107.1 hypothetical protein [Clostridium sp.]